MRWGMGRPKYSVTLAVAFLAVMGLSGCTKKHITNYPITDGTHVRGIVKGWRCAVGGLLSNRQGPWRIRFSVYTGEPAVVTFIRDNGFKTVVETDDSSQLAQKAAWTGRSPGRALRA